MITQEQLKQLLDYNPNTGLFTRLTNKASYWSIGDLAGNLNKDGYIEICTNSSVYLAHRLAFLYMTGKFPEVDTDHIDTIRHHNWWSNLREATKSENGQNLKKAKKNNLSTGVLGVYIRKDGFIYSKIKINRKQYHLGYFNSIEEASNAYIKAKRELHAFGTL